MRDLILNHFWLKLFSLVLASLIWLAISSNISQGDATRIFSQCPVLLMSTAGDQRTYVVEPNLVNVTVRGPVGGMAKLQDSDIRVYVQADAPRSASGAVTLKVHAPHGFEVLHVNPALVTIKPAE